MASRLHVRLLAAVALIVILAGCNRAVAERAEAQQPQLVLPSQILGLKVTLEDVSNRLQEVDRPYFDSMGIFSLREGELLRASFQVARFNALARPKSARFRQEVIQRIGSRTPQPIRVGKATVNATTGNKQNLFVWFRGRGLFVLVTHQDYPFPRTLLRRILALDLDL